MPLNRKGKEIKHAFEVEYGKKKGDNYFYGWENKHGFLVRKHGKK